MQKNYEIMLQKKKIIFGMIILKIIPYGLCGKDRLENILQIFIAQKQSL